jgi:hypothetical protein
MTFYSTLDILNERFIAPINYSYLEEATLTLSFSWAKRWGEILLTNMIMINK